MKKYLIFLGIILFIAVLASYFASGHPDGLEFVAENLGFIDSAVERGSFMTDYHIPILGENPVSTAFSGVLGILLCLGVFWGVKKAAS